MSTPFNLSRYNLVGFNVTPLNQLFAKATANDRINFICASTTNNAYPKARLYDVFTKVTAVLVPGRFSSVNTSSQIVKNKALLIGCSWRKAKASDVIMTSATKNRYFWRKATGNDALSMKKAQLIGCSWREAETTDVIDVEKAEINGYFWRHASGYDAIGAEAHVSQMAMGRAQANDEINASIHLSEMVFIPASTSDEINVLAYLGQNAFTSAEAFNLINAVCSAMSLDIKTCVLTVALKPGDTMIIDANTYNVWINQQNAVYVHSGDWLDELDRNTLNFEINAASGLANLEASILYTERYL